MKFKLTVWRATLLAMSFLMLIGCMFNTSAQTSSPPDPDGLLDDLYWAMTGGVGAPPAPNWEARLDPGFSRWRTGSSENWGPIAHAIALWRYDVNSPDTVTWWNTFFDCQNGGACSSK